MNSEKTARNYSSKIIEDLVKNRNPEEQRKTEKKMLLAVKIADVIKEKGMSRKEFAEKMGRKPSQISNWLAGIQNFQIDTLFDIEAILDIKIINVKEQKQDVCAYFISFNVLSQVSSSRPYSSKLNYSDLIANEPLVKYNA